jgi:CubicO group peptidase (beta-lactamase class C family)
MQRTALTTTTLAAALAATTLLSAAPKFTSVWRSSDAGSVSFAGKKVAALVISQDDSLRVPGEEALAKELIARGLQSVATYRIAPKEEMQSAERARPWFERANVEGVVALRPVGRETRTTYTPDIWTTPYYSSFWSYYGYGWGNPYITGSVGRESVVVVETTIYSVPRNQLLWAAVSETRDSKSLPGFVQELVKASVKEMQKQGLAKSVPK